MKLIQFDRKEKVGIITLLVLISLSIAFNPLFELFYVKVTYFSEQIVLKDQESTIRIPLNTPQPNAMDSTSKIASNDTRDIQYFYFDPNTVSPDSLKLLGFSKKVMRNLVKYRLKGGKFYKKEDVLKIYGMDSLLYDKLSSFIEFKKSKNKTEKAIYKTAEYKYSPRKVDSVAINAATQNEFMQLPGIGEVFSSRIIKFRSSLGGFYSIDQIAELYGLTPETFEEIKGYFKLDTKELKKIAINKISRDSLSKHPYVSYKDAKRIISYRNQHGDFRNQDHLKEILFIDKVNIAKLIPYLIFNSTDTLPTSGSD